MNYIRRHEDGIEISNITGIKIINDSLKNYINILCFLNVSTFDARRDSTAFLLNEYTNVPIYVDEEVFLYPTKSIRTYDTVFVNFHEVLSVKKVDKRYTKFIFTNLSEITLEISIYKVNKQHNRINKILEIIK